MAHIICAEADMETLPGEEGELSPERGGTAPGGLLPPSLQMMGSVAYKEPSPNPAGR